MRMIGLIGGMSWESTAIYYRRINEQARTRLGGLHSAEIVMRSVDFAHVVALQTTGEWKEAGELLGQIGKNLQGAGAECLLICTNTMHKLADDVTRHVDIPLLHIVDVTAVALAAAGRKKPLLLATRYTMEQAFYVGRLRDLHDIEPIVPNAEDRCVVHDIIFDDLCRGVVDPSARKAYREIIARGAAAGADSVILGCTEIGLLIGQQDVDLPVFDSTMLHADAAVDFAFDKALHSQRAA